MSFEPRDYLRHIPVEADYLIGRCAGLSFCRRTPDGPALALLRVAARNPKAVIQALHTEPHPHSTSGRNDGTR